MPVITRPEMEDEGVYGSYANHRMFSDPDSVKDEIPVGFMQLNTEVDEEEILSTILHETQHYISGVEGWENGGSWNPKTARQYIEDQLKYSGQNNMAGDYAEFIRGHVDAQDGLFEVSKRDRLAQDPRVQQSAYRDLSGEELARAVEDRWKNNTQGEYFYGSPDKHEEQNWNKEGDSIIPLETISGARQELSEAGLLGVLDRSTIKKIAKNRVNGEDVEYEGPYTGKRDQVYWGNGKGY